MSQRPSNKDLLLSPEQALALELLESGENVFLTGGAGTGKSYVVRAFRSRVNPKTFPLLASTGAAAVLIGGRTFHSFFGLGLMEGGPEATIQRACSQSRTLKRMRDVEGVIVDEISMIPTAALEAAERICRVARESQLPWGGLRILVVGDFAQLPPVQQGTKKAWCFQSEIWQSSGFQSLILRANQRVQDSEFLSVLKDVRTGHITPRVRQFLDKRLREHDPEDSATRLFPRRDQAEAFNLGELKKINSPDHFIDTIYFGESRFLEQMKKSCPLPEKLNLKVGCRVLFLQNDPQKRWVNGTRGEIVEILPDRLTVCKDRGRDVTVEKSMFSLMNADGEVVASALNFPVSLAYATTIHKSQGATLSELWVDLSRLWEPGHAYVALSRLTSAEGLRLLSWNQRSFIVDPAVIQFYQELEKTRITGEQYGANR